MKLALFDLDGTLIDSEPGILATLRHTFAQIDATLPEDNVLRGWIGPPFHQTFPSALGDDPARIESAIATYRERYLAHGWKGHTVYPGIAELIGALAQASVAFAVVTTKPAPQARKILDTLPFGANFTRLYTPEPMTMHSAKAEMIAQALADFGVTAADAVMIGDREFDIAGARANGVFAIGVAWGFGSREELNAAGADAIVVTPAQLGALLATLQAAATKLALNEAAIRRK